MLRRHSRGLLTLMLMACYILTAVVPVMALDEPNPEGIRQGDRVDIKFWEQSPNEDGDYKSLGIWDIKVNGVPKGKSLYFQHQGESHAGTNMIHPSKVMEWVKPFNGSENYVNTNATETYNRIRYGGGATQRVHVRDLAELCGMHYYDSVNWTSGSGDAHPTSYPQAQLSVPAAANPGMILKWKARGESNVQSRIPERKNRINYTVKVDSKIVTTKALNTKSFNQEGTYSIPKGAKSGTKILFELAVSDGAGRISTVTQEVMVQEGQVNPNPPDLPKPIEPPAPPPPPNYEPKADFMIGNPTPVEGEQVTLKDRSTHEGIVNGEKIVSYEWEIEGNDTLTGKEVTASWDAVGTYNITLTVEDQDGDSDSCTKSVVVGPALPAAVIFVEPRNVMLGRKLHIDGDQSVAAMEREILWDEMQWEFIKPDGTVIKYTGRYPLPDRNTVEKIVNMEGHWKVRLKVKDTEDNESEWAEDYFTVYPDKPPIADFWVVNETTRYSYNNTEVTIYDQSMPDTPDASLGDELFKRHWVLYYDANNNGGFTDSVDEKIFAGQNGKAAKLIEADGKQGNDLNPKIRFYKTGRYKLELTVQERHIDEWDNQYVEGLTADTSLKPQAEKEIMVLNIAPTVAFDIKKKVPVDVVFGVDPRVTDNKYISLMSADARFKNRLEGAYIIPNTEYQRADKGKITELFSYGLPDALRYDEEVHVKYLRKTNEEGKYNLYLVYEDPYWMNDYSEKFHIDLNNGEVKEVYLPLERQEPTYIYKGTTGTTYNGKFKIVAEKHNLKVYRGSTLISSVAVPTSDEEESGGFFIAPWKDGKTVVLYKDFYFGKQTYYYGEGHIYLYLIDNNTGSISNRHEYLNFFPTTTSRYGVDLRLEDVRLIAQNSIGFVSKTSDTDSRHSDLRASIITPNLTYKILSRKTQSGGKGKYFLLPLNDNYFRLVDVDEDGGFEVYLTSSHGNRMGNLPRSYGVWEWNKSPYASVNENSPFTCRLPDDSFAYLEQKRESSYPYNYLESKVLYFDSQGSLKWSYDNLLHNNGVHLHVPRTKVLEYVGIHTPYKYMSTNEAAKFLDYIILTNSYEGHGSVIKLVDAQTGVVKLTLEGEEVTDPWGYTYKLPLIYAWNDDKYLFYVQGDKWSGKTLKTVGQLQGLQYLEEVIKDHPWEDTNNFIVSVTDQDSYIGFTGGKGKIATALNASSISFSSIAPDKNNIKNQTEELANLTKGGWWIKTDSNMVQPLDELAQKIIALINEERGADNIVLVNQEVELKAKYQDAENDPQSEMWWEFQHNPNKLGEYTITSPMGLSSLNGKKVITPPISFALAGTYQIKCQAKDLPVTNERYRDSDAGAKWSGQDASLTVLVHRKPIANFTVSSSSTTASGAGLVFTDLSYDPDLQATDPEEKKGIRTWEWQYRNKNLKEDWKVSSKPPKIFESKGEFDIRLRVQDVHGAWSNWSNIKSINVINTAPVAGFEAIPNPVVKGENCTLVNHSWDPDGDQIVECEWTIEGKEPQTTTDLNPLKVRWDVIGNYTVTLRVKDSEGKWSNPYSSIVQVIYNNKPVAKLSLPTVGYSDEEFIADGRASYDPDPEDRIELAFWQYRKPGATNWTAIYTQHRGDPGFLKFGLTPADNELGTWMVRLVVEDSRGLQSMPVERAIEVQEGWEISGFVIPEVGERGRKMIVAGYAHRKGRPNEKYQINSMKAELAYLDAACTKSGRAVAEGMETLNMPYYYHKADYRVTHLVGEEIYETNRWPADGRYYIKVIGQKGSIRKEIVLPFSIKGNIHQRLYIQTRSW